MAAVEYHAKMNNFSIVASEQEAIDCDLRSNHCNGGWPTDTLLYVRRSGITDGRQYRYITMQQQCMRKHYMPVYDGIRYICQQTLNGDEQKMKALVAKQPVIAGFKITKNFLSYKKGVFSDVACTTSVDHGVVK